MSTILVIEDDPRIQKALVRQFSSEGYEVHVAGDGNEGSALCKSLKPTAVVLDLMLPGKSGREVCREIKSTFADLPVIVLSAVTDVADKVLLLELGADDYVTKPFSPRELQARVQAAVRRSRKSPPGSAITSFGDVTADFVRMEVRKNNRLVAYGLRDQVTQVLCRKRRTSNHARETADRCLGIQLLSHHAHRR